MKKIKPWALGPFELIQHAEIHRNAGSDFDRRMALVSYDNSIEVSIITFLSLNPIQRGGRTFNSKDVERWTVNYHSKIEFIETYVIKNLKLNMEVPREEIIFYHQLRNELYHKGNGMVPTEKHVEGIREAALWVFSVLFELDAADLLENKEKLPSSKVDSFTRDHISESSAFLEAFIEMRKDLNDLLHATGYKKYMSEGLTGVWGKIAPLVPEKMAKRFQTTLSQAPKVSDAIVNNQPTQVTEKQLKSLSNDLVKMTDYIMLLRDYQNQAIETAFETTIKKVSSGEKNIGLVVMPAGAGLTVTAIAYMVKLLAASVFVNYKIIVTADRMILESQLFDAFCKMMPSCFEISIKVTGMLELKKALVDKNVRAIFASAQKLRLLAQESTVYEKPVLVIHFNMHYPIPHLSTILPTAFEILFTNVPPRKNEFGEVAFTYSLEQALKENPNMKGMGGF